VDCKPALIQLSPPLLLEARHLASLLTRTLLQHLHSRRCPFGTTTDSGVTINIDEGYCSKYIQGYGLVNGATALCAVRTFQTPQINKDFDGEACATCPVGYTTSDVGSINAKNCSREFQHLHRGRQGAAADGGLLNT
jgi:hypothetical protein